MKKTIGTILLSISLIFSMSSYVYAADSGSLHEPEEASVIEKKALRSAHINDDIASQLSEQGITIDERNAIITELLSNLTAYEHTTEEQEEIFAQLERLGIYAVQSTANQSYTTMSTDSSPEYMSWRSVVVTYDAYDDTWLLGAGGNWSTSHWTEDIPWYGSGFAYEGMEVDIGGTDGVGIRLYDTSGEYYPTTLEDSWLYVSDGYQNSHTSYTRTAGINPSDGVFFDFQDYVTCFNSEFNFPYVEADWLYYGRNFSVFARYSSDFENYHGYAEIQYVHTWSSTEISSVAATLAKSPKFEIEFSNGSNYFSVTSESDTVF